MSMHREMRMSTKFWLQSLKERDNSQHLGIDVRIILKWILKKEGVDRIQIAEDRVQWMALVNMVMNLWIP
jgi:hypothetical protein